MNWENPVPGRWFSGAAAVCLGFALAGCGSSMISTNATPAPVMQDASLAFVANTSSNTISAFQVDPSSGKLFPVVGNPFPTDSGPEFLAVSAASKFLFVGNSGSRTVSAFQIDAASGALTVVPGSPFVTGARPEGVIADPMGR